MPFSQKGKKEDVSCPFHKNARKKGCFLLFSQEGEKGDVSGPFLKRAKKGTFLALFSRGRKRGLFLQKKDVFCLFLKRGFLPFSQKGEKEDVSRPFLKRAKKGCFLPFSQKGEKEDWLISLRKLNHEVPLCYPNDQLSGRKGLVPFISLGADPVLAPLALLL